MRVFALTSLFIASVLVAGCGARQVEISEGPAPAESSASITISNTLSQAVNVYILQGSNETFVRQLAANSTQMVALRGVTAGGRVVLRARTADGTRTFTSDELELTSGREWRVP